MSTARSIRSSTTARSGYRSGERAREQLLNAAGEVFAEKGFDRATSREICERADMNLAAVNYHFGGIDRLYVETLRLARQGYVTVEFVQAILDSDASPREKLFAYLDPVVRWLANPAERPWQMRLVTKEMLSPSGLRDAIVATEIQPKIDALRQIVADAIGAATDAPVVGQAVLTIVAPTMILAAASTPILQTLAPSDEEPAAKAEALAAHCLRFILGGLDAVEQAHRSVSAPPVASKNDATAIRRRPRRRADPKSG